MALSLKVSLTLLVTSVGVCLPLSMPISDEFLDRALKDKWFVERQLKCVLGEVWCDPVGSHLKGMAPQVLRGVCPKCSDQKIRQVQRVLTHTKEHYPEQWRKISKLYAP
uniref:Uncharacterized protein n=1 Tax=Graphocephala atropunctata TaxID=36148 RepID=A0A1B6KF05_9HEMI